jgi:hypothetical protein
MTMAMYDPALEMPVLHLLDRWGNLPLSDLERLLDPLQRTGFRIELIKDMEWEGLITAVAVGDELVLALTPRGRARLAGRPTVAHPPRES